MLQRCSWTAGEELLAGLGGSRGCCEHGLPAGAVKLGAEMWAHLTKQLLSRLAGEHLPPISLKGRAEPSLSALWGKAALPRLQA